MFMENIWYIFSTFNILTANIYNIVLQSEFGDDNLVVAQYDFPHSNIEATNALSSNKFPENFHFGITTAVYNIEKGRNIRGKYIYYCTYF